MGAINWQEVEAPALMACSLGAQGLWARLRAICDHRENGGLLLFGGRPPSAAQILEVVCPRATTLEMVQAMLDELEANEVFGRTADGVWRVRGRRPLSRAVRESVFLRDNGECQYCWTPLTRHDPQLPTHYHADHVVPWIRGGSDEPENLKAACKACNLSKHTATPEEWMQ